MARYEDLRDALVELLVSLNAAPDNPISLYEIGPPLVTKGYTQDEIVNTLFTLQSEKAIELLLGNRLCIGPSFWMTGR